MKPVFPRLLFFLFIPISQPIFSQQVPTVTQDQINKMIEEAKQQARAAQAMQKRRGQHIEEVKPEKNTEAEKTKNKTIHSADDLAAYVSGVKRDLFADLEFSDCKLENPVVASDAAIIELVRYNPTAAMLLAMQSVLENKSNVRAMNNLGAILNECGRSQEALAILLYANTLSGSNPTILNNLGITYAYLGDIPHAEKYLQNAIFIFPIHPTANMAMAVIMNKNKNRDAAVKYSKAVLKGGFISRAWQIVKSNEKEAWLSEQVKSRVNIVDFVKREKPLVPDQCRAAKDAAMMHFVYDHWKDSANAEMDNYEKLYKEYSKKGQEEEKMSGANITILGHTDLYSSGIGMSLRGPLRPFDIFAWSMYDDISRKWVKDLNDNKPNYSIAARDAILAKYSTQFGNATKNAGGNDKCQIIENAANAAMAGSAAEMEQWQLARFHMDKEYVNQLLYWSYVMSANRSTYYALRSKLMSDYISEMERLAATNIFGGCDPMPVPENQKGRPVEFEINPMDCPYDKMIVPSAYRDNYFEIGCFESQMTSAASSYLSGCGKQITAGRYRGVVAIALDPGLKQYLVIDGGIASDLSLTWDKKMAFSASSNGYWLNNGIISIPD